MPFKTRVILYALLPLVLITSAVVIFTSYQINSLSNKELLTFREGLQVAREREIINYLSLAKAAIQPILNSPDIDEKSAQERVKKVLDKFKYGDYYGDGYFFVYNKQGVNIVHPVQKDLVGKNLYYEKNSDDDFVIQSLLKAAKKEGGGSHTYKWNKPSVGIEQEKTSHVVTLEPWGWVLGTGFYHDDILKDVTGISSQVKSNIRKTFYIILALTLFSIVLLGFLVYWHLAGARLRELASRYILLQVEERRGFARELHDNVGQLMVAAKYEIELAMHKAGSMNHMEKAQNHVDKAIRDVRDLSHDIRPPLMDESGMGLKAALKSLLNQYRERIEIDCQIDGVQLSEDIEITLYRITQEALSNIDKHAKAQKIVLKLRAEKNSITLEIQDDGKGFSHKQAHKNAGIGLQHMRERAELLGGTFSISTSSVTGTKIRAKLPLRGR